MFESFPDKVLTIIHDKMDHSKIASPHFSHKSKAVDSFIKLHVSTTGMIAHGHRDVRYAHYGFDVFKMNSNHTVRSIARLLRDLESPSKHSLRRLSPGSRSFALAKALFEGSEICDNSQLPFTGELVEPKPLLPTLTLQLDNACWHNKN